MKARVVVGVIAVVVIAALWLRRSESPAPSVSERQGEAKEEVGKAQMRREGGAASTGTGAPGDQIAQQVEHLSAEHRLNFRKWHTKQAPDSPAGAAANRNSGRGSVAAGGSADESATDDDAESSDAAEFDSLKRQVLADPDPEQRIDALTSLYPYDDDVVLPVLKQALADRDAQVRLAALEKIGALDEPPLDLLSFALKDPDPEVRERAVILLSYSEDEGAVALIRDAHNDSNEDVRNAAQLYGDIDDIELGDE